MSRVFAVPPRTTRPRCLSPQRPRPEETCPPSAPPTSVEGLRRNECRGTLIALGQGRLAAASDIARRARRLRPADQYQVTARWLRNDPALAQHFGCELDIDRRRVSDWCCRCVDSGLRDHRPPSGTLAGHADVDIPLGDPLAAMSSSWRRVADAAPYAVRQPGWESTLEVEEAEAPEARARAGTNRPAHGGKPATDRSPASRWTLQVILGERPYSMCRPTARRFWRRS
jgi:hypothetical protein